MTKKLINYDKTRRLVITGANTELYMEIGENISKEIDIRIMLSKQAIQKLNSVLWLATIKPPTNMTIYKSIIECVLTYGLQV